MIYHSKIDFWLLLVFIFVIGVSTYSAFALLNKSNVQQVLIPLIISVVLGILFPLSALLCTYYKVTDDKLIIRSSIFSWKIPIEDIRGVREEFILASSPALSMDRIVISYRHSEIAISPRDKEGFMNSIIQVSKEGTFNTGYESKSEPD